MRVEGITYGKPFFIKYGRVWAQDEVARLVNCDIVISLIGERPGLVTSRSLAPHMVYRPDENTVEADQLKWFPISTAKGDPTCRGGGPPGGSLETDVGIKGNRSEVPKS